MALGEVEGLEVVPLGLDLGAELDLVAEALEHGLDLAPDLGEDMNVAASERRPGKRDVDRLRLGDIGQPRTLELRAPRCERRFDGLLGLIDRLAKGARCAGSSFPIPDSRLLSFPLLRPR